MNPGSVGHSPVVFYASHSSLFSQAPAGQSLKFIASICEYKYLLYFLLFLVFFHQQYINTINQTNIHTNHHDKTNRHTPQTIYQYSSCLHALAALMLPVKVAQAPAAAAKTSTNGIISRPLLT